MWLYCRHSLPKCRSLDSAGVSPTTSIRTDCRSPPHSNTYCNCKWKLEKTTRPVKDHNHHYHHHYHRQHHLQHSMQLLNSQMIKRLHSPSIALLPIVIVMQLITARRYLCVKDRTVGRRVALGSHLGSVESHLVLHLLALLLWHSPEFDRCNGRGAERKRKPF